MKKSLMLAALLAFGLPGTVLANDRLAQDKQCMGCHALKQDGAALSFHKIATFWKGRQDAEARQLARWVLKQ
jgi:cytochrome c